MARPLRIQYPGAVYHVISRGGFGQGSGSRATALAARVKIVSLVIGSPNDLLIDGISFGHQASLINVRCCNIPLLRLQNLYRLTKGVDPELALTRVREHLRDPGFSSHR